MSKQKNLKVLVCDSQDFGRTAVLLSVADVAMILTEEREDILAKMTFVRGLYSLGAIYTASKETLREISDDETVGWWGYSKFALAE